MDDARPLREVFADLAGGTPGTHPGATHADAGSALGGHEGLPADLLATAIGSYADTAPAEVAEHLAPFLTDPDAGIDVGLELLADAPVGDWDGEVDLAADLDGDLGGGLDGDLRGADALDHLDAGSLDIGHLDPGYLDPGHLDAGHVDPVGEFGAGHEGIGDVLENVPGDVQVDLPDDVPEEVAADSLDDTTGEPADESLDGTHDEGAGGGDGFAHDPLVDLDQADHGDGQDALDQPDS
jgi:hypothetical protein